MFGSFAYAGFFPPAESMGSDWFDGSTIWDLDIFSAVNKCLETTAPEDVVVDVVMTSAKTLKKVDASGYHSINMLWRFLEVSRYYSAMDGLLRAQFAYPTIDFRYIISPSADLPDTYFPLVSTTILTGIQVLKYPKLCRFIISKDGYRQESSDFCNFVADF
jgi:hypothetical protein